MPIDRKPEFFKGAQLKVAIIGCGYVGLPLACDHCERPFPPHETQCPVCDSLNPWARRDSVHFWCRECGNTQTFYSEPRTA